MFDQRRYVLAAFGKRRQTDGDHVQPIVEVLAKSSGLGLRQQVAVAGGDYPRIDVHGLRIADALEFVLLQHS